MKIIKALKILYLLFFIYILFVNLPVVIVLMSGQAGLSMGIWLLVSILLLLAGYILSHFEKMLFSYCSFFTALCGGIIAAYLGIIMLRHDHININVYKMLYFHTSALILTVIAVVIFIVKASKRRNDRRIVFYKTQNDIDSNLDSSEKIV